MGTDDGSTVGFFDGISDLLSTLRGIVSELELRTVGGVHLIVDVEAILLVDGG